MTPLNGAELVQIVDDDAVQLDGGSRLVVLLADLVAAAFLVHESNVGHDYSEMGDDEFRRMSGDLADVGAVVPLQSRFNPQPPIRRRRRTPLDGVPFVSAESASTHGQEVQFRAFLAEPRYLYMKNRANSYFYSLR